VGVKIREKKNIYMYFFRQEVIARIKYVSRWIRAEVHANGAGITEV
jgi:hypothetical protein